MRGAACVLLNIIYLNIQYPRAVINYMKRLKTSVLMETLDHEMVIVEFQSNSKVVLTWGQSGGKREWGGLRGRGGRWGQGPSKQDFSFHEQQNWLLSSLYCGSNVQFCCCSDASDIIIADKGHSLSSRMRAKWRKKRMRRLKRKRRKMRSRSK